RVLALQAPGRLTPLLHRADALDVAGASPAARAPRERQCRRAAKQRDEFAPVHSITSSARASSVGGISRPSAMAVFRLMTGSYFVGALQPKRSSSLPGEESAIPPDCVNKLFNRSANADSGAQVLQPATIPPWLHANPAIAEREV